MPLVACPDCGTDISDQAPACVRCGRPMQGVPVQAKPVVAVEVQQGGGGNVLAALASFAVPGLGQLVQGRLADGVVWFLFACMVWLLTLGFLGWTIHIWAAVDAAHWPGQHAARVAGEHDRSI